MPFADYRSRRGRICFDADTSQGICREARLGSEPCLALQQFGDLPETVQSRTPPEQRIPPKLFERCSAGKAALPLLPFRSLWMRSFPRAANAEQRLETPSFPYK